MITAIATAAVYVEDQEKSAAFWTEQVGFTTTRDEAYGGERWVEVTPPDGSVVLVLSPRDGHSLPDVPEELPHSPLFFHADDVQATHRELSERGVRFAQPPRELHFGWWALFEDPDGTRYALGEWESGAPSP